MGSFGFSHPKLRKKRAVTMKNRPWLLIIVSLASIILAIGIIRPVVQGFIAYLQAKFEPDIWFWHELAVRLEAGLFLFVGALGILGLKRWGIILLWISAFVLGAHWWRVAFYRPATVWVLGHLPLLIVPLLYWKRLTWKT